MRRVFSGSGGARVFQKRTGIEALLAVRRALMQGRRVREIVRELGLSEASVNTSVLCSDLPRRRCPLCGGLVVEPCLKCFVEGRITITEG